MILLDTHIWVWWTHDDDSLPTEYKQLLQHYEKEGLGVSVIMFLYCLNPLLKI